MIFPLYYQQRIIDDSQTSLRVLENNGHIYYDSLRQDAYCLKDRKDTEAYANAIWLLKDSR